MSLRKATVAEICTPKAAALRRRVSASALGSNRERLDSWKQIALYLNREVRTVQRWEKSEDLPVHRHTHLKGSTVYAFKKEIDVWLTGRGHDNWRRCNVVVHCRLLRGSLFYMLGRLARGRPALLRIPLSGEP